VQRVAGKSGFELARQIGVLRITDVALNDVADRRCRIDDLLVRDASNW
jgi:hypothetical protein